MRRNRCDTGERNSDRVRNRRDHHGVLAPRFRHLDLHPVERVDVTATTQEALPQDQHEDDPNRGREHVDRLEDEEDHVDELQQGHHPDVPEVDDVDGRSRDEHSDLVEDLVPAVLLRLG